jgi:hypothetical protein
VGNIEIPWSDLGIPWIPGVSCSVLLVSLKLKLSIFAQGFMFRVLHTVVIKKGSRQTVRCHLTFKKLTLSIVLSLQKVLKKCCKWFQKYKNNRHPERDG